jgi:hypothetical protein
MTRAADGLWSRRARVRIPSLTLPTPAKTQVGRWAWRSRGPGRGPNRVQFSSARLPKGQQDPHEDRRVACVKPTRLGALSSVGASRITAAPAAEQVALAHSRVAASSPATPSSAVLPSPASPSSTTRRPRPSSAESSAATSASRSPSRSSSRSPIIASPGPILRPTTVPRERRLWASLQSKRGAVTFT